MGCSCRTWGQVRPQHGFRDHFDDLCWNHSFLRGDNSADPASLGAKALCGQEPFSIAVAVLAVAVAYVMWILEQNGGISP
jgi:hypothetical protein